MNVSLGSWQRLWRELGAARIDAGLFNQLVAAYSEGHRHYHTLQHLRECLALLEAAAALAQRPAEVEAALWFHDAVYDPHRADNEERSAEWAQRACMAAGCAADVAQRVRDLVLATRHGSPSPVTGPDADLLLDIDLAILGATPSRFGESSRQVRAEYGFLPEHDFRQGRAKLLRAFLERPSIYRTAVFRDAQEAQARTNLQRELVDLESPAAAT
jgi:predicted metal-dependent HD superfamily phosphohydrolase